MRSLITLLLCLIANIVNAQGTLMTVAGTGVAGFSGDGGDARLARISWSYTTFITTDLNGNVYFADPGNYRIRKVDRATGLISTIAGTGGRGYSGDGGPATLAEVNKVRFLTFDWKGNLLIIDTAYCRIRSISPSGIISYWGGTTCGDSGDGGPVTSAKIFSGAILAGDSGKLYCLGDYTIKLVDSKGIISRIGGTVFGYSGDGGPALNAQVTGIGNLAFDKYNNLVLADGSHARRIRQIDSKGIIRTIAGNGSTMVTGDGGNALLAGLGTLFSVAYDQFGNMFISSDYRIRKVDIKDSVITTIAGTGVRAYSGEGVDAKTNAISATLIHFDTLHYELYFADSARIRKITNLIKPVSISETAKTYTPEIFPNPVNTKISVSGIPIRSEIWIYDLLGREHLHTTMSQMEVDVDVSGFAPGTYILRAKTPTGKEVHSKFLKQ